MSGRNVSYFASSILVGTCGRLLFQQRDNVPGIGYPGWLSLFGGEREDAETFRECVSREIHEEVGHELPPAAFESLGPYTGISWWGVPLVGEFFLARDLPVDRLNVTEGTLLLVGEEDLANMLPRFAPSSRVAVERFLNRPR